MVSYYSWYDANDGQCWVPDVSLPMDIFALRDGISVRYIINAKRSVLFPISIETI